MPLLISVRGLSYRGGRRGNQTAKSFSKAFAVEGGQYPLDIYTRWFRDFLTFVVPLGCVSYFPVAFVLGHANRTGVPDWLLPLTPVVGFVFFAISLWVWRYGVRRHTSTSS